MDLISVLVFYSEFQLRMPLTQSIKVSLGFIAYFLRFYQCLPFCFQFPRALFDALYFFFVISTDWPYLLRVPQGIRSFSHTHQVTRQAAVAAPHFFQCSLG